MIATLAMLCILAGELHQAVRSGDVGRVKELLEAGAAVNERDSLGGTALHEAAWNGDRNMAWILIAAGADPNVPHTTGEIEARIDKRQAELKQAAE